MSSRIHSIGLKLDKVPLINLRFDFREILSLFRDQRFRNQFPGPTNGEIRPIATNTYVWHGLPNELLTHILRDAIVGLESAVSGAVYCEAIDRNCITPQIMTATRDPFSLRMGGTAGCVYNGLPSLIDEKFRLDTANPELWETVKDFYKNIRNPIFHSFQVCENDPVPAWNCLELIWEIYQWLNSWHPVERIAGGMISWSEKTLNDPSYVPALSEERARQLFPERSLLSSETDYLADDPNSLKIEFVKGVHVNNVDRVDIFLVDGDGKSIAAIVPAFEAMRLQHFLSQVKRARGWQIPEDFDPV